MSISEMMQDVFNEVPDLKDVFSELGKSISKVYDTEACLDAIDQALEYGKVDVAEHFLDVLSKTVDFWSTAVEQITGKEIYFDVNVERWRDADTGRFVKDPYVIIRANKDVFEEMLREKYD